MTLLLDIGACCEAHTNDALEHLHKAIGEGDPDAIWNPHHSPFISRLIELFTERGLLRLDGFRLELDKWLAGEMYIGAHRPPRPAGMMERWTPSEQALVKLYLESIPSGSFTLDDYMLCVDYLQMRYLPVDQLKTEADWLATRSVLMGRVQANMAKISAQEADALLEAMPVSAAAAMAEFAFTPVQSAVLEYAVARGCENVVELTSTTRHNMKVLIQRKMMDDALGLPTPAGTLQTQLFDKFGELNRDWRRIALTEAAENSNQGYIASLPEGAFVRRMERYKGACPFCKRIDGRVMKVVAAGDKDKDGDTCIWPGKTNIGRSASPRRRQGGILVERQPDEMWWIAAGTQHPFCRGSWAPEIIDLPGEDARFGEWCRKILREKKS